jgi:outer membrane autotransporter protein
MATFGVFAGYSATKLDGTGSIYKSDGASGGAYVRVAFSPQFRVTGTVGVSGQDVTFDRTVLTLRSVGKTDRSQTFGSLAVDGQFALGTDVVAVPTASVLFSNSKTDAYVDNAGRRFAETDADFSLGQVGSTFFYTGGSVLPYAGVALNHQFNKGRGSDRTYGVLSAGVAAPIGPRLNLVVGAQTLVAKRGERETSVGATLRQGF